MLAGLCCLLLSAGLSAGPAVSLRPAMLDAPREALQRGDALLAQGNLSPAAREQLLRDMATAAVLVAPEQAQRIAAELDALGREGQRPAAAALADLLRAGLRLESNDVEAGLALANSATATLRNLDQPYWSALADLESCHALLSASRSGTALRYCERAHAAAGVLDEYERAKTDNLMQWALYATGAAARALPFAESARARYVALGSRGGIAMMDDNIAGLQLALGKPALALAASRSALAYELANGKIQHSVSSRQNVAKALAALGQPREALKEIDTALATARRLELGRLQAQLLASQAQIAEHSGRLALALAATRELIELNARLSSREVERAVAELDAHYGAQARESEIRALRQAAELQTALLRAAEADKAGERTRARFYALALVAALCVGVLLAALIALRLRWLARLNAALEQVNRTRADMLAMAAHEVRNPMAAISGLIDMALHRINDRRARGLLETARATSIELVRTAEDYLDHAQLALDRMNLRQEAFDLPALLAQVAGLFHAELAGRPLRLVLQADPELPRLVCGDAARLQQVLVNLLGNAVKFTSQGEVRLEAVALAGEWVRFRISDSGPGIAAHEVERLLQPFERGDGRTRRGTGLGLSIANQLIQVMGGQLQIETEPGIGSRFAFNLHLAAAPRPAAPVIAARRGRVLLVDDDPAIRELLSAQLDALSLEHRVAAGIDEALAIWREFHPETLLVDLHLDRENGVDLIRRLRAECAPAAPPRCLIHSASPPDGPHDRTPPEWNIQWVRKPMPLRELGRLLGGDAANMDREKHGSSAAVA
ncbi:ATP-binding protein [Tahibacter harae]|uniref:histidine kinase n=1 Tax=Tahibacter harae TaxID=2963937 RepID=A0ABT1QWL7_9GAMM|nr:hybrid sensor histidine kinase/response regulator [Tahibacter harae]